MVQVIIVNFVGCDNNMVTLNFFKFLLLENHTKVNPGEMYDVLDLF